MTWEKKSCPECSGAYKNLATHLKSAHGWRYKRDGTLRPMHASDKRECNGCTRGSIGDYYTMGPSCPLHRDIADVMAVDSLLKEQRKSATKIYRDYILATFEANHGDKEGYEEARAELVRILTKARRAMVGGKQ